jgi:2-keto-4-pentenoate hydratase
MLRAEVASDVQTSGTALLAGLLAQRQPGAACGGRRAGEAVPDWCWQEARRLLAADESGRTVARLSKSRAGVTLDGAYQVQWCGVALRIARGAAVIGHKVGLTSVAMQEQMGIAEPDSGILLDCMAVANGAVVASTALIAPRVEAEIAFRLGRDLVGRHVDAAEAEASIAETMLALEIIDSRVGLAGVALVDSIADNAACARFCVGAGVAPSGVDLAREMVQLRVDDRPAACGRGSEVLGHPVRALVWLVRRLAAFGCGLRAGDIVLAGAVHASIPLRAGQKIRAVSPHLPPVGIRVI